MQSFDRHLTLVRQAPAEFPQASGDARAWVTVNEKLRQVCARDKPLRVRLGEHYIHD